MGLHFLFIYSFLSVGGKQVCTAGDYAEEQVGGAGGNGLCLLFRVCVTLDYKVLYMYFYK